MTNLSKYAIAIFCLIGSSHTYATEPVVTKQGSSGTGEKKKKEQDSKSTVRSVPGILLPGAPTDLASAHLQPYLAARTVADMRTTGGAYNQQLTAIIQDGATVGQVNKALQAVEGRIGHISKNSPVVTIQVPDPGSIAALERVAKDLEGSGAFESVGVVHKMATK